ncbi:hypothetical protein FRC07_010509 [Ceratobasidium sp. 392]|nr:hypothetical protein FRC07_010509 [Ceratobasidium sp. 392]
MDYVSLAQDSLAADVWWLLHLTLTSAAVLTILISSVMKRTQQSIADVRQKIRRLAESPERSSLAAQSTADPNPGPSHAGPSTEPLQADSSLGVEQRDEAMDPGLEPPVSLQMDLEPSEVLPNLQPGYTDAESSTRMPSTIPYTSQPGTVRSSNPAPAAAHEAKSKQSVKRTAWSGLETLVRVMSKSSNAFGPLKSAADGLSRCIEIFELKAKAHEEYKQLRTELNSICEDISGYIDGNVPSSMTPSIAALARGIEEETKIVIQKEQRTAVGRYAEATKEEDEIVERYRRIQMLLNRVALNANMNVWKVASEEATQNRLERLPYSSAAKYRSMKSDSLGRNGCTPNTRVDVLEQMRAWAEDDKSQRIYWLNGMAGTGKTTIAYSLCEQMHEGAGKLAASFFCSRQLPSCRDVGLILPSIAYQLSCFSGPFRCAMSSALGKHPDVHNEPVDVQFKNLIAKPLSEAEGTFPEGALIVIDALDECEDDGGVGKMIYALLQHAVNLPMKFFVTSRPDTQILYQMRSELGERVGSELRLHELDRSMVHVTKKRPW